MENRKATAEQRFEEEQSVGTIERRYFPSEARAAKTESGEMRIGGYGAIFNRYTNMGWYAEIVMPGFFDGIKDDRCACLFNHDSNVVLGRKKNDTLTLKIDPTGLDYSAKLPDHRTDVYELVHGGYIYESSFAFTTLKTTWEEVDRSVLVGHLTDADLDQLSYGGKVSVRKLEKGRELFDVSPVTYAAYEGTTTDTRIARRSFMAWRAENPEALKEIFQKPIEELTAQTNHRARLLEAIERAAK